MDISALLGRREEAEDICALPLVRRLAALLDQNADAITEGDPLPLGWHVCLFASHAPQSKLGVDGIAEGEALLPSVSGYPRRMAGGRRISNAGSVRIGSKVRRVSTVVAAEPKQGRSGSFLLTTVRHEIFDADTGTTSPVVVEEYDTVFREAAEAKPAAASSVPQRDTVRRAATAATPVVFDSKLLFRYSAVMYNAHRIHYDHPYATGVEGYPDLVVNGSLTVLTLLEFARKQAAFQPVKIAARNILPLYAGRAVRLCLDTASAEPVLWAENQDGDMAVQITML
jgi:3-methylfumaryl-CoA hydratase